MTDLRTAAQQALEALEQSETFVPYEGFGMARREAERKHQAAITALRAALAQQAEPVQKPVAGRAFLERILAAMEGVIDVADRKTDEFDALRSCVIDLTLMLHTAPPQRKPLTEEEIERIRAAEQDRCCRIIYGMAGSDNVAQRTVDKIRGKE